MYADLAFLIVVVVFALIGLWKGFFKTLISFGGSLLSFLAAFFLAKPITRALLDIPAVQNFVVGNGGSGWSLYSWFMSWLPAPQDMTDGGMFGTLVSPIINLASSLGSDITESVALMLSNGIFSLVVCLGLFIVIRLLMILATMYANAATQGKLVGALNRFLGFVMGAVKGFGIVIIIMSLMSFFMGMNFMAPVREQFDNSVVSGPVYTQVIKATDKIISGGKERLQMLLRFRAKAPEKPEKPGPDEPETSAWVGEYTVTSGDFTYVLTLNADGTCSYGEIKDTKRNGTYTLEGEVLTVKFDPVVEGGEPETVVGVYHSEGWVEFDGDYLAKEGVTPPAKPSDPFGPGTYKSADGKITLVLTGDSGSGEYVLTVEGEELGDSVYSYYEGTLTLIDVKGESGSRETVDLTVTDGVINYKGIELHKEKPAEPEEPGGEEPGGEEPGEEPGGEPGEESGGEEPEELLEAA